MNLLKKILKDTGFDEKTFILGNNKLYSHDNEAHHNYYLKYGITDCIYQFKYDYINDIKKYEKIILNNIKGIENLFLLDLKCRNSYIHFYFIDTIKRIKYKLEIKSKIDMTNKSVGNYNDDMFIVANLITENLVKI